MSKLLKQSFNLAIFLSALSLASSAHALNNGLALTPPMGWNTWNFFGCNYDENVIKQQANLLVSSGLAAAGYNHVNIDGCWQLNTRDGNGNLQPDPGKFPNGLPSLVNYLHGLGLKVGIYTDVGTIGCGGYIGSYGHEAQDATQFAAWGFDYVKIDWCGIFTQAFDAATIYDTWRSVLATYAPAMTYSICNWGHQSPWNWGPSTGNLWRTTIDIWDEWSYSANNRISVMDILDATAIHAARAGPGAWNDPDMLVVGLHGHGNTYGRGMTTEEYRSHFSLWAILSAPLLMGHDLTNMNSTTLGILNNREVIAVNQDPLGIQAGVVWDNGAGLQVYAKPIAGTGARAVVLLNRTGRATTITVNWRDIGLTAASAMVRNLWTHSNVGSFTTSYTANVPSHGVMMLKVVGAEPTMTAGTNYLSDSIATLALNGWGPVEKDMSNGERATGDGVPLTLNSTSYTNGLGVHANSRIEYNLGGTCSLFRADIGVDDEVGSSGSVVFEVWADSTRVYRSPQMTGSSATQSVNVNISGAKKLKLLVLSGGDHATAENSADHADWAEARVTCAHEVLPPRDVVCSTTDFDDGTGYHWYISNGQAYVENQSIGFGPWNTGPGTSYAIAPHPLYPAYPMKIYLKQSSVWKEWDFDNGGWIASSGPSGCSVGVICSTTDFNDGTGYRWYISGGGAHVENQSIGFGPWNTAPGTSYATTPHPHFPSYPMRIYLNQSGTWKEWDFDNGFWTSSGGPNACGGGGAVAQERPLNGIEE